MEHLGHACFVKHYPNHICHDLQTDPTQHLVKFVDDVLESDRLSGCSVHLSAVGNMTKDFLAVAASRFRMVGSR